MSIQPTAPFPFLAGVIEGFYGQPWSEEERFQLLDWMSRWRLNTYVYAPKDDLQQRSAWRDCYPSAQLKKFKKLIQRCRQREVRFIYALSPGLDIRYRARTELDNLQRRFQQMLSLGCEDFALLFDDIPDQMHPADRKRFASLASAQCHVANTLFKWLRARRLEARLLFCPTPYCGRMAQAGLGGRNYLPTVGRELLAEIDVFWTGPEIISQQITVSDAQDVAESLGRRPVIWDNLHANDYDGQRLFCGPYAGRPPELCDAVRGLLLNPNTEFPLNFVPLRTFAAFLSRKPDWAPREAYLGAMREWLPSFATIEGPASLDELVLFGDCYYLPHGDGPGAEALYEAARLSCGTSGVSDSKRQKLSSRRRRAFLEQAGRLRQFCNRLGELGDRDLFYALSRRAWELREELDLLERYVAFNSRKGNRRASFRSDFHLPKTYRGGFVARLQELLVQDADGCFRSSRRTGGADQ